MSRWVFPRCLAILILSAGFLVPVCSAATDVNHAPNAESAAPAAFKSDSETDAHRIAIAASFLLVIGLAGVGTVYYARRGGLVRIKLTAESAPLRVLSARRVTPRLTLVKVQIDDQRTVVIADNGSHLLLVADDIRDGSTISKDA